MPESQEIQQLQQQIVAVESKITEQIDRLYAMAKDGSGPQVLQLEYKRAVEEMTKKFSLMLEILQLRKDQMPEETFTQQQQQLQDGLKEDVVLLATAVDEITGSSSK